MCVSWDAKEISSDNENCQSLQPLQWLLVEKRDSIVNRQYFLKLGIAWGMMDIFGSEDTV